MLRIARVWTDPPIASPDRASSHPESLPCICVYSSPRPQSRLFVPFRIRLLHKRPPRACAPMEPHPAPADGGRAPDMAESMRRPQPPRRRPPRGAARSPAPTVRCRRAEGARAPSMAALLPVPQQRLPRRLPRPRQPLLPPRRARPLRSILRPHPHLHHLPIACGLPRRRRRPTQQEIPARRRTTIPPARPRSARTGCIHTLRTEAAAAPDTAGWRSG
jgi:hypothetical protein